MDDAPADILRIVATMTPVEREMYHHLGGTVPRDLPLKDPGWFVPNLPLMQKQQEALASNRREKARQIHNPAPVVAKAAAGACAGDVPRPVRPRSSRLPVPAVFLEGRSGVRGRTLTDTRRPGKPGNRALKRRLPVEAC